ncbi:sialate O-acetylesterase [Pedobacter boryungensis]|uniref:Sialate O-acetylesterase n=1 Tax=Pedobacter boryungensis TaxID=869962 RepID=A0ABX2DAE4_9SPHI|nr:sialate O-acetylesterase [Pedobacter boryungensis]NQX31037.1 sialate O-acetylesterase [Pedobacter boryungensis]
MKSKIWIILLLILPFIASAEVKLPSLIADGMVLQQKSSISLWGWANPDEKITVVASWDHQKAEVITNTNGEWLVKLKTPTAGGPFTITISGTNKIEIKNVLVGEVWLCSGQSNMEFPLQKTTPSWKTGIVNYESEIAKANYPNIRMFTVKQTVAQEPQQDVEGKWEVCSPATAGKFSAVAYYFGLELTRSLNCPIGLIHSSWGGTPAESWVKKEVLEKDTALISILTNYDKDVRSYKAVDSTYQNALTKWKEDKAKNPSSTVVAPKKPVEPTKNSKSATKLYNGMIAPLIPFTIKGVIWYQGESNSGRAYQYRKLFPALINSWRSDWKTDFPFYFVQIAVHYQQLPEIREAQLFTMQSTPQTGMAVITDVGDSLNIHPTNKEVPGHRLALWALAKTYNQTQLVYSGPLYQSMRVEGNNIILKFRYADGLLAKGDTLTEFTIANSNQQFIPATAVIKGDEIWVSSPSIKKPIAVRFAWKNFCRPNLYNAAGLPASPFRTDNWTTKN